MSFPHLLLEKELQNENLLDLFYDLEIPLVEVLIEMEKNGVSLNVSLLNEMSLEFEQELMKLEDVSSVSRAESKKDLFTYIEVLIIN